jgi:tetratricopeptide (TPR) repeat protein
MIVLSVRSISKEVRLVKMLNLLLMLSSLYFCSSQINQDEPCDSVLSMGIDDYESGAYTKSIKALNSILNYCDKNSKIEVNKYLAFNYISIGDEVMAVQHFKKALSLDPDLQLDDITASSEINRVFEAAKRELAHESGGCSCFIPGIGQFMKGEDNKGRAIIAASGLTLTTAVITWAVADSKHNHYLSLGPEDIDDIDDAYNDYNRWRKTSIIAATTFVGIYVYSIFDAILSRKPPNNSHKKENAGLKIDSNGESISVSYRIGL